MRIHSILIGGLNKDEGLGGQSERKDPIPDIPIQHALTGKS